MLINGSSNIYSLYNTMFQSNMALYNNKLSQSLYSPVNKADSSESLSGDALKYVKTLKTSSKGIRSALNELTSGAAFSKKTVTSSDTDVMSVKYSGRKAADVKSMTVNVDQTAASQKNEGAYLQSGAAYGNVGKNEFSVEVGGKKTTLSINVSSSDTNEDVQKKMADAINDAELGITATVEKDAYAGTSALNLRSDETGDDAKNKFSVKDVSGNLVAKTGIDNVTQNAQDAVYRVNGGEAETSKTNTVDLGNGVSATFKKVSDKAVTLAVGNDGEYAKSLIADMVNSYNDMYSAALDNAADPKAEKLIASMLGNAKTYQKSLSDVGIGFDIDGYMTVDEEKLGAALDSGKLESLFTENRSFGFASQLDKLAGRVQNNTNSFVSKSSVAASLSNAFSYNSLGSVTAMNTESSLGWLFDYSY